MPPAPDRRRRNAAALARLRAAVDRLGRLADVTGGTIDDRVDDNGTIRACLVGYGRRPNPPCRSRARRG